MCGSLVLLALASVSAFTGSQADSALAANDVSFLQHTLEVQSQAEASLLESDGGHGPTCKGEGILPSVLLIGLPHAGTTSLAESMNEHPQLSYGLMKEHRFFATFIERRFTSVQEYKESFCNRTGIKHHFDATPATIYLGTPEAQETGHFEFNPLGIPAIQAVQHLLGPGLRIIVMIRDPVDVQVSSFGQVPDDNRSDWRTCYANPLRRWMQVIGRDKTLVLKSEEFFTDPDKILNRVYNFLDVAPMKASASKNGVVTSGRRRSTSKATIAERLAFHSRPTNFICKRQLEELVGSRFDWPFSEPL